MIERFPVDFETLEYGDVIPASKIEQIFQVQRNHRRFGIDGCLKLITMIVAKRPDLRGHVITINDDVVILAPFEASRYQKRKGEQTRRRQMRVVRDLLGIDRGKMSPEEQDEHDRAVVVNAHHAAALRDTSKKLKIIPAKRQTPGLPGK